MFVLCFLYLTHAEQVNNFEEIKKLVLPHMAILKKSCSVTVSLYLLKFEVTTLNSASTVFRVSAGATEWRWHRNWHLTWRLSDRWGTIRSTSACHPSRSLRKSAAGKDPVNCLQMCLDACFTDKHVEGAALWWYHRSLLICISLPERVATLHQD